MSIIDSGRHGHGGSGSTAAPASPILPADRLSTTAPNNLEADDEWVVAGPRTPSQTSSNASDDDDDAGRSQLAGALPLGAVDNKDALVSLRHLYNPAAARSGHPAGTPSKRLSIPDPKISGIRPLSGADWMDRDRLGDKSQQAALQVFHFDNAGHHDNASHTASDLSDLSDSDSASDVSPSESSSDGDASSRRYGMPDVSGQDWLTEKQLERLYRHASILKTRRTALADLIKSLLNSRSRAEARQRKQLQTDNRFLNAAQIQLAGQPVLLDLLDQMRKARNEQREADQRIDEVVGELLTAEKALDIQERIFFSVASGASVSFADLDSKASTTHTVVSPGRFPPKPVKSVPYLLTGISGLRPGNTQSMLDKLQDSVRNLKLTEESLLNLEARKDAIDAIVANLGNLDYLELRRAASNAALEAKMDANVVGALDTKFSKALSKEDRDFLDTYTDARRAMRTRREHALQRIAHFEAECRDQGLLPAKNLAESEAELDIQLENEGTTGNVRQSTAQRHSAFTKLLSNPASLLWDQPKTPHQALVSALSLPRADAKRQRQINEALRELNIDNLLSGSEMTRYTDGPRPLTEQNIERLVRDQHSWHLADWINRWLLHKLHMSAMEAELFHNVAKASLEILDSVRWQKDALRYWTRDEAANPLNLTSNSTLSGYSMQSPHPSSRLFVSRRRSDSDLYMFAVGDTFSGIAVH
ncbi:hypothetical protein Micbo1qcDRAFT_160650 [Microdochium bolleyi]|uniref:Uncharacterized protein n=1 Tax=Microdochium bolleyi TaxID=196109 RepID=A0A136J6P0_9PEZI|nr:hypothetical protein Micbo1qcDRAFT_160650 [Microdochium bolleyi]